MPTWFAPRSFTPGPRGFAAWVASRPGAVSMAGLLAFAGPATLFTGALSVIGLGQPATILSLGLWWLLYGLQFWLLLLLAGHVGERLCAGKGRLAAGATWLALACAAAAWVNVSTAGRASLLIEHGVVQSARTMGLYSFILSLTLSLLYFAHLGRSRTRETALARLVAAQAATRPESPSAGSRRRDHPAALARRAGRSRHAGLLLAGGDRRRLVRALR
jgi:hypothetical protein